jgi:virulence-associated protein VagC
MEVYIRRDETTGEVILSPVPNDWGEFFALREQAREEVTDFLKHRDDAAPQVRKLI